MRYLVFLLVLLLPAASAQNFGFEEGMANWETFPATVKDYGADVSQDWSSEGNHSLLFGGSSGIPSHRDDSGGAVRHNSSIVKEGDEVCIDIHAQTGFDGPWRGYSSLSSVNFRDFIHSEDYTNTCITAQKGGSIDIVVRGTATSGRCSSCKAWVYIDNVHIYSCTNGIKDGEETDVDCGRRCAQCANGKGCATNSDCSSFFCDGAICKEAQNYSYHHNYNFEQGEQTFWIFEGKGVGGVGASVSPDWSSEGNYGMKIAGLYHGLNTKSIAVHNTTSVAAGDEVCMDMKKESGNGGGSWHIILSSGGELINGVANGIYRNLCAVSTGDGSLGIEVMGTAGNPCGGQGCLGYFYFDNFTINAANCTDGVFNRVEADVDCGGFCPKCAVGKTCQFNFDCASGNCSSGACTAPSTCSNLVQDDGEEGIDCGSACNITCERALLERYAPVLYFHPDEQFFPTSIEAMLNESDLKNNTPFVDEILASLPVSHNSLTNTQNTTYLDMENASALTGGLTVPPRARFNKYHYTVYGKQQEINQNVIVLQYWFFYVFNDWNNNHEGDWEMIQLKVDKSNLTPIEATYSFHWGGITHNWSNISKSGTHPKVYVVEGGHGSWSAPGNHDWAQEIFGLYCQSLTDRTAENGPSIEIDSNYSLDIISNNTTWINFAGKWGEINTIGTTGPDSPPKINYGAGNRWKDPLTWANNPLPDSYAACTGSPVNLYAIDETGHKVGVNSSGGITINISNTYLYVTSDEGQEVLVILDSSPITFIINSTGDGEFNLSISNYNSSSSSKINIEYKNVQITNSTTAFVNISSTNPNFIMLIDDNRDGNIDSTVTPANLTIESNISVGTDVDDDGFADFVDNCPNFYNPSQINDSDGDGFKNTSCGGKDCDDASSSINPSAVESCNGIDDNCDGNIDTDCSTTTQSSSGGGRGVLHPSQSETCEEENCRQIDPSNQKKSFQNIQQLNRPESPHSFDLNTLEKLKLMGICLDVLDRNNINIMCYFDLNSNKTTKYSPFNTITGNTVLNNKHFSLDWLTDIIKTFRRWVVKIFA